MPRANFNIRSWAQVADMLKKVSLIVEVVDARNIYRTRIRKLERGLESKLVIAATKSDLLAEKPYMLVDEKKVPIIYCSSKTKTGIKELKAKIYEKLKPQLDKIKDKKLDVLIFGIPNVGKSSIINSLLGKKIAKTGFRSGITRGIQWLNLDENIRIMDAPGLVDVALKIEDLALRAAIDVEKLKEPIKTAERLIVQFLDEDNPNFFNYYKIEPSKDIDTILTIIAKKRGRLLKGGDPDLNGISRIIVRDFQKGKFTL